MGERCICDFGEKEDKRIKHIQEKWVASLAEEYLKWNYYCISFRYLNESNMDPTLNSTESMAALCEWGSVEPEDGAVILIQVASCMLSEKGNPEKEATQEAEEALRNELLAVCWVFA